MPSSSEYFALQAGGMGSGEGKLPHHTLSSRRPFPSQNVTGRISIVSSRVQQLIADSGRVRGVIVGRSMQLLVVVDLKVLPLPTPLQILGLCPLSFLKT